MVGVLDAEIWEGWFDRTVRDSGAIMVGGILSGQRIDAAVMVPGGSSYGERVDVQGWYDGIATATNAELGGSQLTSLMKTRCRLVQSFGGTSGASAQIAGLVALINAIAQETWGALGPD